MSKSKAHMPKDLEKKCHFAIHSATTAAAAAGAIPIPISDAIPISAAQIGMIIKLGKTFDVSLSESAAKSVAGIALAQGAGRTIAANLIKAIPGPGRVVGSIVGAVTAATLTEALGWVVADDFFRMSIGQDPENLVSAADELKQVFNGFRYEPSPESQQSGAKDHHHKYEKFEEWST